MLYTYRCQDEACKKTTDARRSIEDRDNAPECEHCGGVTRKIISMYRVHSDIAEYYDDNLETHITGKQHRERVMKEKGVSEIVGKGWSSW